MVNASDTNSSTSLADPTLLTLVPQPSRRRNLLLAVAAALILCAAWASPPMLRPSVNRLGSSGSWSALGPHHQVVVVVALKTDAWPYATLSGVDDVTGAHVARAWLLPSGTALATFPTMDPTRYATGLDYLQAQLPDHDLNGAQLPQRLHNDRPATLIILWNITDCPHLHATEQVRIALRSFLGTTTRASLPEFAGPGFDPTTLLKSGTCPST